MGADAAGVDINLDNFGVGGVEGPVGELGAKKHQGIGIHHGMETRGEANQSGHPDIIGIIILNVLFATQGMDDRGL